MKDGAAEMAWGLRVYRPLPEDPSLFPTPLLGGSQPPVTLAPKDPTSLASMGSCTHMNTPTLTNTHRQQKQKSLKIYEGQRNTKRNKDVHLS